MNQIINQDMTDYAHLVIPDYMRTLREAFGLAPLVPTGQMAGKYMSFDEKMAFVVPNARRASGGETKLIQFNGKPVDYVLDPNALKTYVDLEVELPLAGNAAGTLERAKVRTLISQAVNAYAVSVFDTVRAATTPASGKGNWGDPAVDPLGEISGGIETVEEKSGLTPNVVTMSKSMWRQLIRHPKVLARFPGKTDALTPERIALEMGETDLKIELVNGRGFRTENLGKKDDITVPFMGKSVYIHYRDELQGAESPSFAATLSENENMVDNVYEYTSDDGVLRYFRLPWKVKAVVKSKLLIYRIDAA
jgi:hypothetical protein